MLIAMMAASQVVNCRSSSHGLIYMFFFEEQPFSGIDVVCLLPSSELEGQPYMSVASAAGKHASDSGKSSQEGFARLVVAVLF